jgi:hypothetical protein
MSLLAEAAIEAAMEEPAGLDPELFQKLGGSSRSLMDRQSRLLAALADRLMKSGRLGGSANLGLYCVLEMADHDAEVARLLAQASSFTKTFEREISPFRVLRNMPVAQAFWSARAVGAEGPVRVFPWTPTAVEAAAAQAELDLADGVCENALVLCCRLQPWQVWGQAWAAH